MTNKLSTLHMSQIHHAAGIFADMSVDGPAIGTLVCIIDRAKNLPNRKTMGKQNPYCAARLGKEAKKTETDMRGGQTPRWDQELRFTVHESTDYFRLKVSIFNDDKRTELIGETWIDLKDLIIPGGGQSDQWHPLQSKAKYAGEVRIEMTYYDTRPEDEAVIERRTYAATERVPTKTDKVPTGSTKMSTSLSGPRQPKEVRRRPLPTDPTGAGPARPSTLEKLPSAPVPTLPPARPLPEHAHSVPPPATEYRPRSHHGIPESPMDLPAPRPMRPYDIPQDFQTESQNPIPVHPQSSVKYTYREPTVEDYEPQPLQLRPKQEMEPMPSVVSRSSRQDLSSSRHPQDAVDMVPARVPQDAFRQKPHSHSFGSAEQLHGQMARYSPRSSGNLHDYPDYGHPQDAGYRPHSNSLASISSRHRSPIGHDHHAEYSLMQPRVDDEDDDGPPPPPPAHRSGVVQRAQQMVPAPSPSYQAYSPEYAPSPRASHDLNVTQSSYMPPESGRLHDHPNTSTASVPASLVAGYDPVIADEEMDRAAQEHRTSRGRNVMFDEDVRVAQIRDPSPVPPYPVGAPSPRTDEHRGLVIRKGSASPETRLVPRRKSVSPQPPPSREREMSAIPFSPDSYDAFNPNAARSAVVKDMAAAYDNPTQAMDAARRNEIENAREQGPIIGDDGREIDPSDHLPLDTWAPEPERKNKKPGVIVRFKNSPTKPGPSPQGSPRDSARLTFKSDNRDPRQRRPQSSYVHGGPDPMRTSPWPDPRADPRTDPRGSEGYSWGHGRNYSTPDAVPQSSRRSVSPAARSGSHSPSNYYATSPGPPIPAKVPIAHSMNHNYPVMPASPGMDALSRELNTIDLGCSPTRTTVRKYVPKTISTGYAI